MYKLAENAGIIKPTVSSYLWEVNNFSDYNLGEYLESPVFCLPATIHSFLTEEWCLRLYPKGSVKKYKDCITIYLVYLGHRIANVTVKLSLLDDKYCKVIERSFHSVLDTQSNILSWGPNIAGHRFVTDKNKQHLMDDKFSILCEVIYDAKLVAPLKSICSEEDNLPDYCRLKEFDEFERLLEAENSTADVTVMIGKHEIKVHKAIIMNRSPVFQAMFEHNMLEKEQRVVEIKDISYAVMKEVFRFIYTAKVNQVERMAGDLLFAAEKYSIKGLKVLCEKQMFKNLALTNAIEYLKLADMCNAVKLKPKIIQFIVRNQKDIIQKPELQLLPVEVVCEVLRAVANNLNK